MSPSQIIDKMYQNDPFSLWLGIERQEEGLGFCKLKMTVRKEMLNGFSVAHGGITFSFADSAFAFASNSRGPHAVSVDTSINHLKAVKEGEVLYASATEKHRTNRLGWYEVDVHNQNNELVAVFKGMVYIKVTTWEK